MVYPSSSKLRGQRAVGVYNHKTIKTLLTLRKLGQGSFFVPITLSGM